MTESEGRHHRAGESIEDLCRACNTHRMHTVIAMGPDGRVARVMCDFCRSEHNYRGGPRRGAAAPERSPIARPHLERAGARRAGAAPFPLVSERERMAPRHEPTDTRRSRAAVAADHPRGDRAHAGRARRQVARRHARAASRHARPAGEELADRDLLPQGRDAAEPAAHARAAGERVRAARRRQGQAAGLHQRLLRHRSPASTCSSPTRTISSRAPAAIERPGTRKDGRARADRLRVPRAGSPRARPLPPRLPDPLGYVCPRASGPLRIDGRLDEAAWSRRPGPADFVDIEGDARPRPPLRTRAKMLWDDDLLLRRRRRWSSRTSGPRSRSTTP